MILNTEAVVLNSRKYGDSSKILKLFTREDGIVPVIAKGARKTRNKYGSSLEPLSNTFATIYVKQGRSLQILSNSEHKKPLRKIYESMEHLAAGLMMLESVSQTQDEGAANEELFDLLISSLHLLDEICDNPFSLFVAFQLYLAELSGFAIDPHSVNDQIDNFENGKVDFSLQNGSFDTSNGKNSEIISIKRSSFEILRKISTLSYEESSKVVINQKNVKDLLDFFVRYFSFHLEKKYWFRTYKLLMAHS